MKTADSIEQQEERKKARDNGDQLDSSRTSTPLGTQKGKRGDAARIAKWKWPKGFAPNPTGKNGRHDLAAEIARAVFENNAEALYKAYTRVALKGNAYAFKELADRAFGKLKETHRLDVSPYQDVSTGDPEAQIKRLEERLGYRKVGDTPTEPKVLPPATEPKPN